MAREIAKSVKMMAKVCVVNSASRANVKVCVVTSELRADLLYAEVSTESRAKGDTLWFSQQMNQEQQ